ncbi:ChbG/HpnK family deacetylase [Acinetobacter sp. NyZ410]|uniref:ChbG/HpnK family deacetylase n=1 Tax=Acinetobacter sp. NyZ410 TaxID=2929509 RepID=UPI001FBB4055|nr:ChbG/HpnK family deacetylase [Acinetobacter sp. NyZ410]UOH17103.1 ChbG/HpnK family deacetylase [Acinetobacter sp. NyZ410]
MKMICYCADDFALNDEISHAVCVLLKKNALQATSCMTQSSIWHKHANKLRTLKAEINHPIEIGLHLNFTHYFDHSNFLYYPLNELMLRAWSRTLNKEKIRTSIIQQWELFVEALGTQPNFVDGHQHIHQFPVIREVLIDVLKEKNFNGWIRNLDHTISVQKYQFKSKTLEYLGAKKTLKLNQKNHFKTNTYFAGIYDFKNENYAALNYEWLKSAQNGLLIMCHPAAAQPKEFDEIQDARIDEYQYFNSEQFFRDCKTFNIELQPIGQML